MAANPSDAWLKKKMLNCLTGMMDKTLLDWAALGIRCDSDLFYGDSKFTRAPQLTKTSANPSMGIVFIWLF